MLLSEDTPSPAPNVEMNLLSQKTKEIKCLNVWLFRATIVKPNVFMNQDPLHMNLFSAQTNGFMLFSSVGMLNGNENKRSN